MIENKYTNIVYIADTLRTMRTDIYNRLTKLFSEIGIDVRLHNVTKDIWCGDYMPETIASRYLTSVRLRQHKLMLSVWYWNQMVIMLPS